MELVRALMHTNAKNRGILMSKKMYTVADIAKITGYNRSTVTRWLDNQKIKNAQMQGNAPLYDAQVLDKFTKTHNSKQSKESKQDKTDKLIAEKDARISALTDEIELLKSQLKVKDDQIRVANQLADQAQKLNLADKPQLTHSSEVEEKKNVTPDTSDDEKQTEKAEEEHKSWISKLFRK